MVNKGSNPKYKRRREKPSTVVDEYALNYEKPGESGECELVIGLDFGTSSTKIVIQAPDLPGSPSYAVNFSKYSHELMPHIIPTKLWVTSEGVCSIAPLNNAFIVKDIKMALLSKDNDLDSNHISYEEETPSPKEIAAAAYLAILLRFSRMWFLYTKQDDVRHFANFIWSVNLGVPSPCIEDNEENCIFRRIGKVAWKLSMLNSRQITICRASAELRKCIEDEERYWNIDENFSCDFAIIPEIAAGAVGYALSEFRREDLHVMVDIGASTVDICSFILDRYDGSNRYRLLITDVKNLGAYSLLDFRLESMRRFYDNHINDLFSKQDPLLPIPEDISPYIVPQDKLSLAIQESRKEFKKQFLTMLRRVIRQTKLNRYPKAPVWKKGQIPILFIGGGSKSEFFRSAVKEIDEWAKYWFKNDGINVLSPPTSKSLKNKTENKDGNLYLTVAWGLSHRDVDIGEIIPADKIPDVEPPPSPPDWRKRFVGKELT